MDGIEEDEEKFGQNDVRIKEGRYESMEENSVRFCWRTDG